MRTSLLVLAAGYITSGLCLVQAQDPEPVSWLYTLQVFTVPRPEGMALLVANLEDTALHRRLTDQSKTKPEILEKLIQVACNGQDTAEVQLANELRYPTEFDPQQLPQQLAIGDSNLVLALQKLLQPPPPPEPPPAPPVPPAIPAPAKTTTDAPDLPEAGKGPVSIKRHPVNGGLGIITSITPTAFETRPLGDVLKLTPYPSPLLGDVSLDVVFTSTRLAGFKQYNGEPQALFSSRKIVSGLKFQNKAPCFLGTFSTAQRTGSEFETKEPTVSLAFVTARSIALPIMETKKGKSDNGGHFTAIMEVISLPKHTAAAFAHETLADAALHARLKVAIKDGTARLESFLSGPAFSGAKAVFEDADTLIYPTQFDPPQLVQNLLIADDALLADLRAGRQTGTGNPTAATSPHNGGFGLMTRATPTAFDSRMLGAMLELEVTRENNYLHILARPQLSRQIGESIYNDTKHPLIEAMSLKASTVARAGIPCYLGTLNRPLNTGAKEGNQEDRTWFTFLTVHEE